MVFLTLLRRAGAALVLSAAALSAGPATGQSGPSNTVTQPSKPAGDAAKESQGESQKQRDEIAEAARVLSGPAGNPECVWLGRRAVGLIWRDDLETAFRHLDLYDRFGCPGEHVQDTFRCLVRQGPIDPKAQETLNGRVFACWLDPEMPRPAAAADQPPAK